MIAHNTVKYFGKNYVFQVQKLLTCLDSFGLRRTSSVMRRLSQLIPAGCVFFFHPQSAQFVVVAAGRTQRTKSCALCGWEKIRIPRE